MGNALDAYRRREVYPSDHPEAGELTVDAEVGKLLEAQTARATVEIAAVLKGLARE